MDFTGKVALITGGANGIGQAAARGFARLGARVVVVDRDEAAGEATAQAVRQAGGDARFVAADVTRSADVQRYVQATLDAYGAIDCFFNNAGIEGTVVPIVDYDEAVFDSVIAVNLKGVFLGLRHVLPVMLRQGRGAVVNTASTAALVGSPGLSAYVASKHGVPRADRHADDPLARAADQLRRPRGQRRALPGQHPAWALCHGGGGRRRGAVSVLGYGGQRDGRAFRGGRRPYRDGRGPVSPHSRLGVAAPKYSGVSAHGLNRLPGGDSIPAMQGAQTISCATK